MTDKPIESQSTDRMGFANTAFLADPYPFLTQLRGMGSVVPISNTGEHTVWLVTKFYEAVQVLKDQRFSVDRTNRGGIFGGQYRKMASQGFILDASMISVDEPSHSRLRNLVSKAFTPGYIESLRPMIQRLAEELLDRWYRIMKRHNFGSFSELRHIFPSADKVGKLTVFNIGGNKYRLIAAIHYNRKIIYIRNVLTHKEYMKGEWKE